ncbi:hypothetical protein SCP_1501500 [Sparassis crispa]|uniref:Retrovirus-related Pol polyprotein from transposon TNT 1-94 n=1 Tax=Sparassis crispa TaxID=139825 RepID=A0A401H402_9APHY|nr:hypothetical protein SCP_1501500 [Sparassis crispa]GBE89144.1 hypothetical protein SCP_1501500 [Sparassis crispa]
MSTSADNTSNSNAYRIPLLKEDNWLPWKCRVEAILNDKGLQEYVTGKTPKPQPSNDLANRAAREAEISTWGEKDLKAQNVIVLSLGDSQMVHIAGAKTARAMWEQLRTVKEQRGQHGILALCRRFYRMQAKEEDNISSHITQLRQIQEQLHLMGKVVSDEDFRLILATSLPESWDSFLSSYFGAVGGNVGAEDADNVCPQLTSQELIAIILDENRRRHERGEHGQSSDQAMVAKGKKRPFGEYKKCSICGKPEHLGNECRHRDKVKCMNCGKFGHKATDCWAKGGGKAGQGPPMKRQKTERAYEAREVESKEDEAKIAYDNDSNTVSLGSDGEIASFYEWFADSGTTSHITNCREVFATYQALEDHAITGIGSQPTQALGRSTVDVESEVGDRKVKFCLHGVLYVPTAPNSLLSITRLDDAGGRVLMGNSRAILIDKNKHTLAIGKKNGRLYSLKLRPIVPQPARTYTAKEYGPHTWEKWHKIYGHIGKPALMRLYREGLVDGLEISPSPDEINCEACIQAKATRKPFPKETDECSKVPGELTHTDVWGPAQTAALQGWKYFITFTDDYSRRSTVLFMRHKDEVTEKVKNYITYIERKFGNKPLQLRLDNGREYMNTELINWCQMKGIEMGPTAPYSPSQNGVSERLNRTLLGLACTMIYARDLPRYLWAEAIAHAVYIKNRSPTQALNGATPEEKWNGTKPNISYLQEFGSPVWVLTEDATLSKLAPRANKYIFVGYMDGPKAIKYYDAHTRQIKISCNFQFSSNSPDHLPGNAPHVPQEQIGSDVPILTAQREGEQNIFLGTLPSNASDVPHAERRPEVPNLTTTADVQREGELGTSAPQSPAKNPRKRRQDDDPDQREESGMDAPSQPRRTRRKTVRHDYRLMHDPEADEDLDNDPDKSNAELVYIAMSAHGNADADEPKTLSDAKRSLEWPKWEQAVQTELNQLQGMKTWELVEPPKDRKPVGNKWVLVKKTNKEGEIIKYKARLVAKGYSQIPGMDYTETFAPVVRLETIRAILGLAAILDWEIGQMDVKGAYLNGTLKEEVYMRQPEGYSDGTYRVCKLKKTLYGLKQSGREWNIVLNCKLLDAGFKRLFSDPCAYIWIKGDKIEIVTVWVDDLLIFTNDCALMDQLKRELRNMFEVTDLGEPQKIVGIEIERDRSKRTIKISQTKYIESILHKNGLTNANTVGMPLDPNTVLEKEEPETDDECDRDNGYASLIGSLMYAAIATRPDIAHAVQRLSSFTANPGMAHWTAAKRVLRYLSGMRELGIIYGPIADVKPEDQSIFVGYSDADYANDIRDHKSISGYIFKLGNGTITWSSKKQTTVASSTTEAEYMASAEAAKEAVWLRTLFKEIGFE